MIQKGKSYVHGTAAEKLEYTAYDVYEENVVLKEKKNRRAVSKVKLKMVMGILFVFALGLCVIFRYAQITELNYNINKSYKALNTLRNENSRLKVDIEKGTDLHKIKELAENQLGMHQPDKFQMVYVNVPKSDFTRVAEGTAKQNKSGNGSIIAILDRVGKFTHLLY